jgi:hypothetical protein
MDNAVQLFVKNVSDSSIYVFLSYEYPDTTLPVNKPTKRLFPVEKNQCIAIPLADTEDELRYDIKSDTLSIFFFDKELYDSLPWDSIRNNYMILDRRDIWEETLLDHLSIYYPFQFR